MCNIKNVVLDSPQQTIERLEALKWYFELKNFSFKKAISYHGHLSAEDLNELKIYYTQYFSAIISATELFREKEYINNAKFKESLLKNFIFDDHTDGVENYNFLREFRNGLIHRGMDIAARADMIDNFPVIHSPKVSRNQSGKKAHKSFGTCLIDLIEKCESVIGNIFLEHFKECEIDKIRVPHEQALAVAKNIILDSVGIPEEARKFALVQIEKTDFNKAQTEFFEQLFKLLKIKAFPFDKA